MNLKYKQIAGLLPVVVGGVDLPAVGGVLNLQEDIQTLCVYSVSLLLFHLIELLSYLHRESRQPHGEDQDNLDQNPSLRILHLLIHLGEVEGKEWSFGLSEAVESAEPEEQEREEEE